MKHRNVSKKRAQFRVIVEGSSSQAAMMTLKGGA